MSRNPIRDLVKRVDLAEVAHLRHEAGKAMAKHCDKRIAKARKRVGKLADLAERYSKDGLHLPNSERKLRRLAKMARDLEQNL
jgi:hypothetical protein